MHWRYCSLAISHLHMAVDALFIIRLYIDPATQVTGKSWAYFVSLTHKQLKHDDVIKWRHFPHYWPFARGIHRSPVNSLHKGQWRGALMFFFICAYIYGWVNNRETGDLRHHCTHYDVIVMKCMGAYSALQLVMPWCWSTRPSVSTVLTK